MLNHLIEQLYEFHFKNHKGQLVVYLVTFILSVSYMIASGILFAQSQQNTIIGGLVIIGVCLIGLPLIYAYQTFKLEKEPKVLLFLILLASRHEDREAILGDLLERYWKDVERFGRAKAKRLLTFDIAVSFLPLIWAKFRRDNARIGERLKSFFR